VEFTKEVRAFTTYTFKPQLRTVGPKYGKQLGEIRNALATVDGHTAMDALNESGLLTLDLPSGKVELTRDDLLIEMTKTEGFETLAEGGITVVIDKTLTPELIEEGNVREIISKIQTMRKDSGFEVTDHIRLAFSGNAEIADIVRRNAEEIKEETLATELLFDTALKFQKSWNVNGMNVEIAVEVN
jgi:isoleucyl-tRNA synthetase